MSAPAAIAIAQLLAENRSLAIIQKQRVLKYCTTKPMA
jgi:hypothetical protein